MDEDGGRGVVGMSQFQVRRAERCDLDLRGAVSTRRNQDASGQGHQLLSD